MIIKHNMFLMMADLPTVYEIKAEDLPPLGKKNAEDFYAGKI